MTWIMIRNVLIVTFRQTTCPCMLLYVCTVTVQFACVRACYKDPDWCHCSSKQPAEITHNEELVFYVIVFVMSNLSTRGIWQPLHVPAMFLLHGQDLKWRSADRSACSFSPRLCWTGLKARGGEKLRLVSFVPELQRGSRSLPRLFQLKAGV